MNIDDKMKEFRENKTFDWLYTTGISVNPESISMGEYIESFLRQALEEQEKKHEEELSNLALAAMKTRSELIDDIVVVHKNALLKARIEELRWLQQNRPAYGTKVTERIAQLKKELPHE